MRIDAWRGLGRSLVLAGPCLWALACAPPCYDDGVLQGGGGCPEGGASGSSTTTGSSSSTTQTNADGTGESGIMTAEGTSGSGDETGSCPGFAELLTPDTRTFELVVEQSGNMSIDLDGVSRYDAVADALFDPMDGVVAQQDETRFGMVLYRGLQAGCPITAMEPAQTMASGPLAALMGMNPPAGSNPAPDGLGVAVTELEADVAAGDKTIVLIMGNEPGSCAIQTPANAIQQATTRSDTVDAVTAAYAAGFPTRVISVGGVIDTDFLQALANEGIGHQAGDPDAAYWVATDREQLRMAAAEITATSRVCEFSLVDPISDALAPSCEVLVNGAPLMYEDADGWDLPDPQTLLLQGAACDSIQSGLVAIDMTCDCDA